MLRLKIGLDWDDVIAPFNSIAIKMANERYAPKEPYRLEEITSWENTGRTSVIKEFYTDKALYEAQTKLIPQKNIDVVKKLMKIADVYIITAAFPEFMGIRAKQIMEVFPELPHDRIILGAAKHLVTFDVILDDNFCNVLESPSQYPVLMRKPWNRKMTGLLSVNTLEEFLELVKRIMYPGADLKVITSCAHVVAVIGPSGSNKNAIIERLEKTDTSYIRPVSYSTKEHTKKNVVHVNEDEFFKKVDCEHTMYGGYRYGTCREDIKKLLCTEKKNAVIPLDMCGAIAVSAYFPTIFVYAKRRKDSLICDIVSAADMTEEEKTLRILSIRAEQKNENLCNYTVDANNIESAVQQILFMEESK